jgi:DNA-binding transcriptional MerR regulator
MTSTAAEFALPEIPSKRYLTIGEVSELCDVKCHVLRYWEQEFPSLKPVKRRGNRRYYQREDVQLIRRIRELLYFQGYTIQGARIQLQDAKPGPHATQRALPTKEAIAAPAAAGMTSLQLACDEMLVDLEQIAQLLSHDA